MFHENHIIQWIKVRAQQCCAPTAWPIYNRRIIKKSLKQRIFVNRTYAKSAKKLNLSNRHRAASRREERQRVASRREES